jgi:putative Mg2+ transporter-C (MgtC) family protein
MDAHPVEAARLLALVAALFFGALIGLERELRRPPAGMHTNALVALGAALYVLGATLVGDPTGAARVAGQVVTGWLPVRRCHPA